MLNVVALLFVLVVLWSLLFRSMNYELNIIVGMAITVIQLYVELEIMRFILKNNLKSVDYR